ncbi:MAG: carboxypeptidase-like regulatory domain-containing protein, partial [Pirellulales bacterium]|nr:carboxypeptidase-like regulatory domain-containing protein [Pirellulales bacterium]
MQSEVKKRACVCFYFVVACVAAAFTGSGCSNNPANYPEVADVVGTVTLDGKPLEGASITFAPQSGRSSSGVTDSSGRYSLNYTGSI